MPDPVVIDLGDGKERVVKFGAVAIGDIEERYGKRSIWNLLMTEPISIQLITALVWGGIRHSEPTLTYEGGGRLVDLYVEKTGKDPRDLVEPFLRALARALAIDLPNGNGNGTPDPNGETATANQQPSPGGSGPSAP
jgi:hypothetical protein